LESSLTVNAQYLNPAVNPRYNSFAATDVNDDGVTTPLDALTLISRLKKSGTDSGPWVYDDVNNDGVVSPVDVLLVISNLNQSGKATAPIILEQDPAANSQSAATEDLTATEEAFSELGAEGEAGGLDGFFADFDGQLDLLASDTIHSKKAVQVNDQLTIALADELEADRRRLGRLR
jgi:Dockerin type I domain